MRLLRAALAINAGFLLLASSVFVFAQDAKEAAPKTNDSSAPAAAPAATASADYSGMYTFLKEGEYVQLTVEDKGLVTGFVSRYGEGDSDQGAFLDQLFKSGKLDGAKLVFTTQTVHGVWFDFKGAVERGDGKNPGDENYYVLKGSLTQNSTDAKKKVSSRTWDVEFKSFPQIGQ